MVVVGVAGYLGFVSFVGSERDISTGIMVLASATGFAAFFSPCSFPLLLTFLARRSAETRRAALFSAFRIGTGALVFFALGAAVVALGGNAFANVIGFGTPAGRSLRMAAGLLLVGFGLRQAGLVYIKMRWLDRVAATASQAFDTSGHSNRVRVDFMYGFGYVLAGFG
jgi:cytochrome c biogenesis protein CcdA